MNTERSRPFWQRFLSTFTILVMVLVMVPFASSQAVPTAVQVLSGGEFDSNLKVVAATLNGITSNIYNQDGLGFSGMIAPNPLANPLAMTGYNDWPVSFPILGFVGGVFDGYYIWMVPANADRVIKVNKNTGGMIGYNAWPHGFTKGSDAFFGGVFDGQNIWLIPHNADRVIKVDKNTGVMTGYNAWPPGFTKGYMAFLGGVFDGQYIWMIPANADRVIKVNKNTGAMIGYNAWPPGFTKESVAFGGGVFDGQNIWMIPWNADHVIKIDKDSGAMTGYNAWPDGFDKESGGFWGGTFDGQNIWMIPARADRVIKIDKDTGVMTGYNAWPDGFTKEDSEFFGGVFDGQNIWMIPADADLIIKVNKNTGVMTGYDVWPVGITDGDFAGGVFDGQNIWMIPWHAYPVIKLSGSGDRPAAPTVTSPISGTLINDATPTFTGTTEPGATIEIRDDTGTVLCATVADGNGDWTCTPDEPLGEGEHALNVVAIDEMANESDPTLIIITVDTIPPAVPTVTSPISGTTIITNTLTFTGTGEPGGTVNIYNDEGDAVCTTTVASDGSWMCTPSFPLDEGEQTYEVTITDEAGNESEPTLVAITVDTPPAAPIVTEPISGTTTSDPTPTFAGTAEPGTIVFVAEMQGSIFIVLCEAVVDENGDWTCTPENPLDDGEHAIEVVAVDEGDNESDPTPVIITVDTTPPAVPVVTEPISGTTISNPIPTFVGTAEPGTTVLVGEMQGSIFIAFCEAVADGNGDWACTPENPLSDGEYTLTVIAVDEAGNESGPTELTFTIKAAPEAQHDTYVVPEGISSTLDVLENDSDPGDDVLTITQATAPSCGVATTDGATVAYTPTAGYLGVDSFTYTISDGLYEDTALVTVTVLPVADLAVEQTARGAITRLEFTLVARNLGPRPAHGAVVSDTFPASLANVTWTCISAGGAVCPNVSGAGHVDETLATFPAGGVVTYTVAADISGSIIENNTVTITPPAGTLDLDMSNNSATRPTLYRIVLPLVLKNATS